MPANCRFQFMRLTTAVTERLAPQIPTNSRPQTAAFSRPPTDATVTVYAWFTNSTESVALQRAEAAIRYTETPPVPAARAALFRERIPGQPVVLFPVEVDNGSAGGTSGGAALPPALS